MTGIYDWNPMPHVLAVRCPRCGARATFEFAEAVRIRRRDEVDAFERSRVFEVRVLRDSLGSPFRVAFFYHRLHALGPAVLGALPPGYAPKDWHHSRYLHRAHGHDRGAVVCDGCGLRRKHALRWPGDAHYQIEHRGHVLWAFDRESAVALRDFVADSARVRRGRRWELMLRHVPADFLAAKARGPVVKKLDRLLVAR